MKKKRITRIIEQIKNKTITNDEIISELEVLESLINNVEEHLESLKNLALEDYEKEENMSSFARSVAYETSLKLFTINMEEGEEYE